jgi:hypothetical protein
MADVETGIIGVVGTLLGAIAVGSLNLFSNVFLNKHRERLEFRTASRLVAEELRRNRAILSTARSIRYGIFDPDRTLTTEAWMQFKSILAQNLPYEAWSAVQDAITSVGACRTIIIERPSDDTNKKEVPSGSVGIIEYSIGDIDKACEALMPHTR